MDPRGTGREEGVTLDTLRRIGLRPWHLQAAALAQIVVCVLLWGRAKSVDQDERANAERRALFVGLWPPTSLLVAEALRERPGRDRRRWRPGR